jgi:hypothetical protein
MMLKNKSKNDISIYERIHGRNIMTAFESNDANRRRPYTTISPQLSQHTEKVRKIIKSSLNP